MGRMVSKLKVGHISCCGLDVTKVTGGAHVVLGRMLSKYEVGHVLLCGGYWKN